MAKHILATMDVPTATSAPTATSVATATSVPTTSCAPTATSVPAATGAPIAKCIFILLALTLLLVGACMFAACSSQDTSTSGVSENEVDAAYIKDHEGEFTLVDVRTSGEYEEGHIPGAVNIVYSSSPCTGSTVAADQSALYEAAGIAKSDALVLYCRTGVRAAAAATALSDAGYTDVKVYTGSWTDWSADSSNEVATGS